MIHSAVMSGRVRISSVLLVGFMTLGVVAVPTSAGPGNFIENAETNFLKRLNNQRVKRGLPKLRMHRGLRAQGRQHSHRMSHANRLSHDGFQTRLNEARPDPREANGPPDDGFSGGACENVAFFDYGPRIRPRQAAGIFLRLWKDSPPHRRCLFDRTGFTPTVAGIGIFREPDNDWWATLMLVRDTTPP